MRISDWSSDVCSSDLIGGQVWPDDPLGGWVEVVDRGLFFPSRLSEAAALQEGVGHHCHERVTVQADPGTPLEVVEVELSSLSCCCACSQIQRALIEIGRAHV